MDCSKNKFNLIGGELVGSKIQKIYHLSPMQEGMLFHSIFNPDDCMYFEQYAYLMKGHINIELLEKSFNEVIKRHDALRTIFVYEKLKQPQQIVLDERIAIVKFIDVSHLPFDEAMEYAEEYKVKEKRKGFVLSKDLLVRLTAIKIADDTYKIIWSFHHIIMDGWCIGIIIREQMEIYKALLGGVKYMLSEPVPYRDFIDWIEKNETERAIGYWQRYLQEYNSETLLPCKEQISSEDSNQLEYCLNIDADMTSGIQRIALRNQVTVNTVFQTIWGILLQKYNNSRDVVFGIVVSGRAAEINGVENIIGLFINTVPVRIRCEREETFAQLLQEVQTSYFDSEKNNYVSLADIQKKTDLKAHPFNHIVTFENYPFDKDYINKKNENLGLKIEDVEIFEKTNYDFNVVVIPGKELQIRFTANSKIYDVNILKNIENHLNELIRQVIEDDKIAIKVINVLNSDERKQLLYDYNNSEFAYPVDKPVYKLFEEQVNKTPDKIAVEYEDRNLTYQQLNAKANCLARCIMEKGIAAGDVVGIILENTIEAVVSILAVMKTGAAYLPIDTGYPLERIEFMLKDSEAKLVIMKGECKGKLKFENEMIDIDSDGNFSYQSSNIDRLNKPADLAYIIYTSGTTGRPKGVMVHHGGLVNYIWWAQNVYLENEILDFPLYSSISFDLTITSIFTPLILGGKIVIYKGKDKVSLIKRIVEENKVGIVKLTPSHLRIIECLDFKVSDIKKFIVGGEDLKTALANRIFEKFNCNIEIYNEYGPTETVVGCMIHKFCPDKDKSLSVPIGVPGGNVQIYLLDCDLNPVPRGCLGEMYISGDGVAIGYRNQSALTAEKFVQNVFVPGQKMYKTGDLARWTSDGSNLIYVGRIDQQVKIRGYRIELGEIESALMSHEEISETLVMDSVSEDGNKYLCAYLVSKRNIPAMELREYLLSVLPEYMVPSYFIRMESFQMTLNGKIDKKALPKPGPNIIATDFMPPTNYMEEKVCEIFGEVLGADRVGIADNFFNLGGDSIKAIQVVSRLQKYNLRLEIQDLFQYPMAKDTALHTYALNKKSEQGIITGEIPLTPIQKWFFENYTGQSNHFNQSVMLYSKEGFQKETVNEVFKKLVEHHDAFRIIFRKDNSNIIQYNRGMEDKLFELTAYDFTDQNDFISRIEAEAEKLQRSFDIYNGPLIKLSIFKTSRGDYLLIAVHHLVIDGVSWRVISEDFSLLYSQIINHRKVQLQDKSDSFQKWSKEISEYADSKKLLCEKNYWSGLESRYNHPIFPCREVKNNRIKDSGEVQVSLSENRTEELLKKVNYAYHTEINDILLTALIMAVKDFTGELSVLINLESHGRTAFSEDVNIERTIGWFTSMYPVILEIPSEDNIPLSIVTVKEMLRKIPNKGIGYGILKYLTQDGNKNEMNFNLKPEINFNYMGQIDQDANNSMVHMSELSTGANISPECNRLYIFDINAMVSDSRLNINFNYNKNQYEENEAREFAGLYKENLEKVIKYCVNREDTQMTPSDYGDNTLTLDELDCIYEMTGKDVKKIYRLSPMQEGMLFHSLIENEAGSFFEQMTLHIKGELDAEILNKSIYLLVERYETFRTLFVYEKLSNPKQIVLDHLEPGFNYYDISADAGKEPEEYLKQYKYDERRKGFDIGKGPLIKLAVFKVDLYSYRLIWSFHHIIMDGWCMGIIINDLFKIYDSIKNNQNINLGLTEPYSKYIQWLSVQDKAEAVAYWRNYFQGFLEPTPIESIESSHNNDEYLALEKEFDIDFELSNGLDVLAKGMNITLNTIVQTIWGMILGKINDTEDNVFGTVVSGRQASIQGIEKMVGLFINTVPVRVRSSKDKTFLALAREIQEDSAVAAKYQYMPLNEISAIAGQGNKLIDHVIIFENYPTEKEMGESEALERLGFTIDKAEMFEQSNYNFNIMITPGKRINFKYLYNGNAYDEHTLLRITEWFKEVARKIIKNPLIKVGEAELISQDQKSRLIKQFKGPKVELDRKRTIFKIIEQYASEMPEHTAVSFGTGYYTYRQINEKANKIANFLIGKGLKKGELAAVMLERSPILFECILAVWKAGGAYIPIDTSYPNERIYNILNTSGAKVLISGTEYINDDLGRAYHDMIADIERCTDEIESQSYENLNLDINSDDLAYVIYTSGSTGLPKGAMVEHIGMMNHINAKIKELQITQSSVVVQNASQCFDISVWQFFAGVAAGGKIAIYPTALCMDAELFIEKLEADHVTILEVVPSFLSAILEYLESNYKAFPNLEYLVVTGEAVKPNIVAKWFDLYPGIKMVNAYGPTEASDDVTHFVMDKNPGKEMIPIGKPIQNFGIYIVDKDMNLCDIGIKGEICVAGVGVGRGYLNDPDKTERVFLKDVFTNERGGRLYRTGDIGRYLSDGNVEFLGRKDNQVKVRGFRIELGEIESVLSMNEGVRECVVDVMEDASGNNRVIAYMTLEDTVNGQMGKLHLSREFVQAQESFLKDRLPEYMIPTYFIVLEQFPLTINGKIDRKALPKPEDTEKEYVAPRNEIEEILEAIIKELLVIKRAGIYDNFFELGGDSIKAIKLVSRIQQKFNIKIHIRDIFLNSTIKELSEYIVHAQKTKCRNIEPAGKKEYYQTSSAQKRLYVLSQIDSDGIIYNLPSAIKIKGTVNITVMEEALNGLIQRHETLRTSFGIKDNEIVQYVHDDYRFHLDYEKADSSNKGDFLKSFVRHFDLNSYPLIRVKLVQIDVSEYILLFDIHHIISDAASMDILFREFVSLYKGNELEPLKLQYKDFSVWQNEFLKTELIKNQEKYWLDVYSAGVPSLNMPTDFSYLPIHKHRGDIVSAELSTEIKEKLKKLSSKTGTTLFMILFSAFNILLAKYTGKEDIVVGVPVSGRNHTQLENVIGMFVNTLAIRNHPLGNISYRDFLSEVKENSINAFQNQDYQFDELVEKLHIKRESGKNPIFDVLFDMYEAERPEIQIGDLTFSPYGEEYEIARFDLTFFVHTIKDELRLSIRYSTDFFARSSIEIMLAYYINVIEIILNDLDIMLADIKLDNQFAETEILDIGQNVDFNF